jgi:DNA-binding response OmpR family regulator
MGGCVLVVEDERKIRDVLRHYLEHRGLSVLTTGSGAEAIDLLDRAHVDLVVLDLGLPDVPGEEVVHRAVRGLGIPVLMLTARAEVEDRIRGLRQGATDYVTKPFSPREVAARVVTILSRTCTALRSIPTFGGGRLTVDADRRLVSVDDEPVDLTVSEWRLLLALTTRPGRPLGRVELMDQIRPAHHDGSTRIVDTHIKNLRRKLDRPGATEPGQDRSVIETVTSVGYRFALPPDHH